MFVLNAKLISIWALILEVFKGLNLVSISEFFLGFYAKEIWVIFKSPVATVSGTHVRGAPLCSMHSVLPFSSVLIGFHVIHPNTSLSSVNEHCQ